MINKSTMHSTIAHFIATLDKYSITSQILRLYVVEFIIIWLNIIQG